MKQIAALLRDAIKDWGHAIRLVAILVVVLALMVAAVDLMPQVVAPILRSASSVLADHVQRSGLSPIR